MEPVPLDDMSRILEQVGVLGFSDELQKRKDGKHSPVKSKTLTPQKSAIISPSPRKGANVSKSSASKEDFVDEDESDVESDDSLADIGSSEDEEMAEKRQNFKPPKLEPEGNEWRCAMCRVINDEGIPKCQSCDTKNPNAVKAAAATPAAASGIQFGFGGGASVGASGAAAIKFGFSPSSSTPKAGGASTSPSTVPPVCLAQCLVCMYCVFVCLHVSRACLHVLCVCVCPKHSWQVSSILLSMPFSLECHLMSS